MYSRKVFPAKILITKLTWLLCKFCKISTKMQIRFFTSWCIFLLNENNLLELYPHIENRQMSQVEIFYTWVLSIAITWLYTLKLFYLKLYKWYSLLLLNKYQSYFHLNTCCTVHICWQGTLDYWLKEQESNSVHFTQAVSVTLRVHS